MTAKRAKGHRSRRGFGTVSRSVTVGERRYRAAGIRSQKAGTSPRLRRYGGVRQRASQATPPRGHGEHDNAGRRQQAHARCVSRQLAGTKGGRPNTKCIRRDKLAPVIKNLGHIKLMDLTSDHVDHLINGILATEIQPTIKAPYSATTREGIIDVLRGAQRLRSARALAAGRQPSRAYAIRRETIRATTPGTATTASARVQPRSSRATSNGVASPGTLLVLLTVIARLITTPATQPQPNAAKVRAAAPGRNTRRSDSRARVRPVTTVATARIPPRPGRGAACAGSISPTTDS